MSLPRLSDHGSEIVLLGMLGIGVVVLIGLAIGKDKLDGLDVAAFLLVLQRIVEAVQKRWEQRGADLMATRLHASKPDPEASAMESVQ